MTIEINIAEELGLTGLQMGATLESFNWQEADPDVGIMGPYVEDYDATYYLGGVFFKQQDAFVTAVGCYFAANPAADLPTDFRKWLTDREEELVSQLDRY